MTVPYTDKDREVVGYMINTGLGSNTTIKVTDIQEKLVEKWGKAIYCPPAKSLHITLMDWIAPLVKYGKDKDKIFSEIYPDYDRAFQESIENISPIKVSFDEIRVSSGAIFTVGTDSGEFRSIRDGFLERVELLPNTKRPPNIIHCTIARFNKSIELEPIKEFVGHLQLSTEENIQSFRLVKETRIPMLDYTVLSKYVLEA